MPGLPIQSPDRSSQHPEFCACKVYSAPFGSECTSEVQTIFFRTAPELRSGGWNQGKLKCYRCLHWFSGWWFVFHIKHVCCCYSFWLDSRSPKRLLLTGVSILYVAFLERSTFLIFLFRLLTMSLQGVNNFLILLRHFSKWSVKIFNFSLNDRCQSLFLKADFLHLYIGICTPHGSNFSVQLSD